jgi:oxygen-independent coproporphyrinogen-3 oxidase
MVKDGLVVINGNGLKLVDEARPYVRNVCMAFDLRLKRNEPGSRNYSMAV